MTFDDAYKDIIAASGDSSDYHTVIKPRMKLTWDIAEKYVQKDHTIVEIGIGPMAALAKTLGGAKLIGVDLGNAQEFLCRTFGIELRTCDLQTDPLPLDNASIDMVFFLEVIEHLCTYPQRVLGYIFDALKPGGCLILSTVNFLRISNRFRVLLGKSPLINSFEESADGHNHIREFLPNEMISHLKKAGFTIKSLHKIGFPSGSMATSAFMRLLYMYPNFRNIFIVVAQK